MKIVNVYGPLEVLNFKNVIFYRFLATKQGSFGILAKNTNLRYRKYTKNGQLALKKK
jgi:hypothetical protein